MLGELEGVEEEEEFDQDEEGEDDTHLPDQVAECFNINTYATRGGRQTKVPVKYTLHSSAHRFGNQVGRCFVVLVTFCLYESY